MGKDMYVEKREERTNEKKMNQCDEQKLSLSTKI